MSDRLLFLERFLMENTDEDTTVSTRDILDAYQAAGFGGNRNIVPADMHGFLNSAAVSWWKDRHTSGTPTRNR